MNTQTWQYKADIEIWNILANAHELNSPASDISKKIINWIEQNKSLIGAEEIARESFAVDENFDVIFELQEENKRLQSLISQDKMSNINSKNDLIVDNNQH